MQAACLLIVFGEMRRCGIASDTAFIVRMNCTIVKIPRQITYLDTTFIDTAFLENINISFGSVPQPVDTVWIEV